ncbi:hypothetical protein DL765_000925 [Monosporascus sp. GIB2]|nr:hypothetical protein DL765_000925 [Monosporascus sp. GIB2]
MEDIAPMTYRSRVLSNHAAEWVEKHAVATTISRLETPDKVDGLITTPEFVPELDRFAPRGVVFDATKYYEESGRQMQKFNRILEKFVLVLKERNVEADLEIVLRNPADFTLDYVLELVNKIDERRESASRTKRCKAFIRKWYRKANENKAIVEGLITIIPNNYGSIISGGFTLILAAVEKHVELRDKIQDWLATIPEQLERIQRLSEIHYSSYRLHSFADAVLVSIFGVLERIVNKLTKTWQGTLTERTRGVRNLLRKKPKNTPEPIGTGDVESEDRTQEQTISDALDEFQIQIKRFNQEASLCGKEKLGEIAENTRGVKGEIAFVGRRIAGIEKAIRNFNGFLKGLDSEQSKDLLMMQCADMLYRFCASSPTIDPKTGEINQYELKLLTEQRATVLQQSLKETNQAVASKWLAGLKAFTPDPSEDVKDYLEHVEQLDADEKCVFEYILDSGELSRWMGSPGSSVLGIDLQTAPARLYNPLSFSGALFVSTLKSTNNFPVLSFFCRYRNNSFPGDEKYSGPVAMVNSLNGQLLDFLAKNRPSKDLSVLEGQRFFSKAKRHLKHGLQMLDALISLLPQGDTVFIILDALSYLSGSNLDVELAIRGLCNIIAHRKNNIIKCMVTDPLQGSLLYKHADLSLHVQDIVAGAGSANVAESSSKIAKHAKGNKHIWQQNAREGSVMGRMSENKTDARSRAQRSENDEIGSKGLEETVDEDKDNKS